MNLRQHKRRTCASILQGFQWTLLRTNPSVYGRGKLRATFLHSQQWKDLLCWRAKEIEQEDSKEFALRIGELARIDGMVIIDAQAQMHITNATHRL